MARAKKFTQAQIEAVQAETQRRWNRMVEREQKQATRDRAAMKAKLRIVKS